MLYTHTTQCYSPPSLSGGGHGRVFSGKGGMRPSYKATDSTAVELPSFGPADTDQPKDTQKRMGFTW